MIFEMDKIIKDGYRKDNKLGLTLELAYWTVWINRLANKYKNKSDDENKLYLSLKNKAFYELYKSSYCKLEFFKPIKSSKVINLKLCSFHKKKGYKENTNILEYFFKNRKLIQSCEDCSYEVIKHYYSLYYLKIEFNDCLFSLHIPYLLGNGILPEKDFITLTTIEENEGIYKFEKDLCEDDINTFPENIIIKRFNDVFDEYVKSINKK